MSGQFPVAYNMKKKKIDEVLQSMLKGPFCFYILINDWDTFISLIAYTELKFIYHKYDREQRVARIETQQKDKNQGLSWIDLELIPWMATECVQTLSGKGIIEGFVSVFLTG